MLCVPPPEPYAPPELTRAALYTPRHWGRSKRVIFVRFLEGDPVVWRRIAQVITGPDGWNSACGLQFIFNQDPHAEVRISFQPGNSWSHVGNYDPGEGKPTMNFGWFTQATNDGEVRRVALHEFGHALGLMHEHETPWNQIPWDRPAVYEYYRQRMGWTPEQVEAQVLTPIAREVLSSGGYDGKSIMHYGIPAELVLDRKARGGNNRLSIEDRRQAARSFGPPPLQYEAV